MTTILLLATSALSIATAPIATSSIAAAARPAAAQTAEGGTRGGVTSAPAQRYCIVETLTGSHIPTRLCKTRAAWLAENFDPLAKR